MGRAHLAVLDRRVETGDRAQGQGAVHAAADGADRPPGRPRTQIPAAPAWAYGVTGPTILTRRSPKCTIRVGSDALLLAATVTGVGGGSSPGAAGRRRGSGTSTKVSVVTATWVTCAWRRGSRTGSGKVAPSYSIIARDWPAAVCWILIEP